MKGAIQVTSDPDYNTYHQIQPCFFSLRSRCQAIVVVCWHVCRPITSAVPPYGFYKGVIPKYATCGSPVSHHISNRKSIQEIGARVICSHSGFQSINRPQGALSNHKVHKATVLMPALYSRFIMPFRITPLASR